MKTLTIKADGWTNILEFYGDILSALQAPEWHGKNVNALIDSMIYGGVNAIEPPYVIEIIGISSVPPLLRNEVVETVDYILKARNDCDLRTRPDIEIAYYDRMQ